MTKEQATAKISLLLQADCEPVLSPEEVSAVVDLSSRLDSNGKSPSDADWTGSYDIYAGAALGWRIKAAKAAGTAYHFRDDTLEMHREQIVAQCLRMAAEYKNLAAGMIPVESYRQAARRRMGLDDTVYATIEVFDDL